MRTSYIIALGSNVPHSRFGNPANILSAAIDALDLTVLAVSPTIASRPLGPSLRTYANGAALIETEMMPDALLDHLKALEAAFGRRSGGKRWGSRVLDLDIILWSGGLWTSPGLGIPHREFRRRAFVLGPVCEIAGDWRDPISGFSVRQLKARLDRKHPFA